MLNLNNRIVVALLISTIMLFTTLSAQGQTRRSAGVRVQNATRKTLSSVTVAHKYSDNYNDWYRWENVPAGTKTSYDMTVWYNTGIFTTGKDWWIVMWTYEKDANSVYLHYTDPQNFRPFIDVFERVSIYGIPITTAVIGAVACAQCGPGATMAMAAGIVIGNMLVKTALNTESTAGFKQHILRDEDSGNSNTIVIYDNGSVEFKSRSGSSTTNSFRDVVKINMEQTSSPGRAYGGRLLRSTPLDNLSYDAVKEMLADRDFFDSRENRQGNGYPAEFKLVTRDGKKLVVDERSGLTWQQSGSKYSMPYKKYSTASGVAQSYVDSLNGVKFAGYDDWRLPTLEEAMSLMDPDKKNRGKFHRKYLKTVFDQKQWRIWTADKADPVGAWVVHFGSGNCTQISVYVINSYFVRAVR